jgi:hypothetical protein
MPASPYLSYLVWEVEARESIQFGFAAGTTIIGTVGQRQAKFNNEPSEELISLSLIQRTQEERFEIWSFFDSMQGRTGLFWIRSGKPDYISAAIATSGSDQLRVRDEQGVFGFTNTRRHLYIRSCDSSHKVVDFTQSDGEIILTLDPVLPADVPIRTKIEKFYLVRFAEDTLQTETNGLEHREETDPVVGDGLSSGIRVQLREMQGETP